MITSLAGQFIGQGLHFGVGLFAALACLAAGWLYLDAWSATRHIGELAKGIGFLLLTLAFVTTGATWGNPSLLDIIAAILKLIGYSAIAWGHIIEPLNPKPKTTGYAPTPRPSAAVPTASTPNSPTASSAPSAPNPTPPIAPAAITLTSGLTTGLLGLIPVAALTVSLLYWRLAIAGLERHLKPLGWAFSIFTVADLLTLTTFWQHSPNPILQSLSAPLGLFWILQHLTLIAATIILGRWVWRYLTKRLLSQLFLTITTLTFNIALFATVGVAALLLASLQRDALASLQTATKVLSYAIDTKTADTRTTAEVLAQNPAIIAATTTHDQTTLVRLASDLLIKKHLSEAVITDESGVVLARASDPDRSGDSLSADPLVQHALLGETSSSLAKRSGALVPIIVTSTASPISSGGRIIGLAITSLALDNAFVDGLKHTTGLDSTVYADTIRSATTVTAADNVSRPIGTKESHSEVLNRTMRHGEIWQGPLTVIGQPYLAVFLPLKDITNTPIGMLFIGQSQSIVLQTAQNAIQLTFAAAAFSLILIMLIVYIIARQITRQLH